MIGKTLGHCQVSSQLGKGGMGAYFYMGRRKRWQEGGARIHLRKWMAAALAMTIFAVGRPAGSKSGANIATNEFSIDARDPGIRLYIRNKHLSNKAAFAADKIVLFVHGATYPSESIFDITLPGGSWMDYAAERGYDIYLIDIRGYGRSTRPASMDMPPNQNPAFATTHDAIADVGVAVDFICKRRNVRKINLVGWSWGTVIMGGFTAQNNDRVAKLVLYAPAWIFKAPPPFSGSGAYRTVTKEIARARGLLGIPDERKDDISPQAWFDTWWKVTLATDPVGAKQNPPVIRAPNGVLKDLAELPGKGIPLYNPSDIQVPTLVIAAEWDQDTPLFMAHEVFARLVHAAYKREVVLAEGTHFIAIEKNRMELIREIQRFLDEPR